jgi:response regulator RpfG family c-di-GMP phosphodiesterase
MTPANGSFTQEAHAHCRILVCDDSAVEAKFLTKLLGVLGYVNLITLTDSREVSPRLLAERFDLILLDIKMPYVSGLEIINLVRQQYSQADLPILVITGAGSTVTRNAALLAGANDYLNKPIDPMEVSLRVRNLLTIRTIHKENLAIQGNLAQEVELRTAKLDLLIENGLIMARTRDRSTLIRHTLFEGQRLLHCDAATMYRVTDHKTLQFVMRTRDDELGSNEIPLYEPDTGGPNERHVSTYCALHKRSVLIDDVYRETRFDLSGTRLFDYESGYRTVSVLTVPMVPRDGEVVGVLQFINKLDPTTGQVVAFSPDIVGLVEALAAQAAVTLDNLQLIDARKDFMESLIHTIATAIDAKSPYTGRHSVRVPELAVMLAEAANAVTEGPLASFKFETEDEWHEFRVGAWLHDCGKITTPEYVIDKSAKLETLYNRIHEIRMRFEVLLRDADIARLQAQLQGGDAAKTSLFFEAQKAQLLDDFAFIAQCNLGSEDMTPAQTARVRQIANTPWMRHFDDRLGLAHEELLRRADAVPHEPTYPVRETLLANMPHHLVARSPQDVPDAGFGFKVDVPDHLYNHGEVYNLLVKRGTLTEEERYKINEHMIHGIMMLERMPFPKSLQRVPEYAGTHHETLAGTGYPRRLNADALSVPARIMAIADIFEALTAVDRPYKSPKKFSEALQILHGLKLKGHIDPDLFDLFLTAGVHLQYAQKFLSPEQVDTVDIRAYLGPLAGPVRA